MEERRGNKEEREDEEGMSHLCDTTVAGLAARRGNVLASICEYPLLRYPPFKITGNERERQLVRNFQSGMMSVQ